MERILFPPRVCDFRPQAFVELLRSGCKRNKRKPPFVCHPDNVFAPILFRRIRVLSEPWKMRPQVRKRVDRSTRQVADVTVELQAPIFMLEQNSHQGTGASAVKSARLGVKQPGVLSQENFQYRRTRSNAVEPLKYFRAFVVQSENSIDQPIWGRDVGRACR